MPLETVGPGRLGVANRHFRLDDAVPRSVLVSDLCQVRALLVFGYVVKEYIDYWPRVELFFNNYTFTC